MTSPRILIVDDEPAIGALLRAAFERAGYAVQVAASVADAQQACSVEEFDAVLSDVLLPDGNGHDLMRWILTWQPHAVTALMSGFDAGCEAGCPFSPRCHLLRKPLPPREAVAVIEDALSRRLPRQSEMQSLSLSQRA
jgi:DNA-binding NtrC family response regulator